MGRLKFHTNYSSKDATKLTTLKTHKHLKEKVCVCCVDLGWEIDVNELLPPVSLWKSLSVCLCAFTDLCTISIVLTAAAAQARWTVVLTLDWWAAWAWVRHT